MLISLYKHSFGDVYRDCVQYLGTCQCMCMQDMGCHLSFQCLQCSALKGRVCWKVVAYERVDNVRKGIQTVPTVSVLRPAGKWTFFYIVPTLSSFWLLSVFCWFLSLLI